MLTVKFIETPYGQQAAGKLIDAELHFTEGPLTGLKLVGFALWAARGGSEGLTRVTFPARQYSINGERRSFALLRPAQSGGTQDDAIRALILAAYDEYLTAQFDDRDEE